MKRGQKPQNPMSALLERALWPVLLIAAIGLLGGWALFSRTGIFAYRESSQELDAARQELHDLETKRAALENRRKLLDPQHVDPDLAEELVRKNLNVQHPNEVVLPRDAIDKGASIDEALREQRGAEPRAPERAIEQVLPHPQSTAPASGAKGTTPPAQ